jgi:cobalt/nickel transport protein
MGYIRRALTAMAFTAVFAAPAMAHEFWIEANQFRVASGAPIAARTLIGSHFLGEELANYASMQRAVDVWRGDDTRAVTGPEEQIPSLQTPSLGDGLHVLRYQSTNFQVTYESYAKWVMFLLEAQRLDLMAQQAPGDQIREVYFRYAKSLIAVGDGQGEDRYLGMPLELVALTNPYQDRPDAVRLRVHFLDEPAPDAAVHVFIRDADGAVTNLRLRTDAAGEIAVPTDIPGTYMVNAIQVLPASARMTELLGADWQSLWASMTYDIR